MNKLKLKRIIIVASFIIIMMTSILKYPSSFASSNANLYLVFDKTTYNVGDIVNININLDQFASLSEVKLQIKIKEEYFEPVMVDNKYFYFSAFIASFFSKFFSLFPFSFSSRQTKNSLFLGIPKNLPRNTSVLLFGSSSKETI